MGTPVTKVNMAARLKANAAAAAAAPPARPVADPSLGLEAVASAAPAPSAKISTAARFKGLCSSPDHVAAAKAGIEGKVDLMTLIAQGESYVAGLSDEAGLELDKLMAMVCGQFKIPTDVNKDNFIKQNKISSELRDVLFDFEEKSEWRRKSKDGKKVVEETKVRHQHWASIYFWWVSVETEACLAARKAYCKRLQKMVRDSNCENAGRLAAQVQAGGYIPMDFCINTDFFSVDEDELFTTIGVMRNIMKQGVEEKGQEKFHTEWNPGNYKTYYTFKASSPQGSSTASS